MCLQVKRILPRSDHLGIGSRLSDTKSRTQKSQKSKKELKSIFNFTNFAELKYYLRVSFKSIGNTIFLSKSVYISCILKPFQVEVAKNESTLMIENIKERFLEPVSSEAHKKKKAFLNGSLISTALSEHSKPTGYNVLGRNFQQVRHQLRQLCLRCLESACFYIYKELRKPGSGLVPLHPGRECKIASLQGFQRKVTVIEPGTLPRGNPQEVHDSTKWWTAPMMFDKAAFQFSIRHWAGGIFRKLHTINIIPSSYITEL